MNRKATAMLRHLAAGTVARASSQPALLVVVEIAAVFAGFLWVVAVAPAIAGLGLAAAVALAWCAWLETQTDVPTVRGRRPRRHE